jgi:hypothetical protein
MRFDLVESVSSGSRLNCFKTDWIRKNGIHERHHRNDRNSSRPLGGVANYTELEEKLRAKGLLNVVDPTAPICRWRVQDVLVDIMPTLSEILGFSNRWYRAAVETGIPRKLPSGLVIQLVRPEYFVATKIEAFLGRGNGDFLLSHDIEDIITVIDGRPELAAEIGNAEDEVRSFIQIQIAEFLTHDEFRNAVLGYLSPDNAGQARYQTLLARATRIGSQEI